MIGLNFSIELIENRLRRSNSEYSILIYSMTLDFPLATFVVNVVGSFFIGWIIASSLSQNNNLKLLLATGFCGGFTTFSTFSLEVFQLFQQQKFIVAIAYIFLSLVLTIAFTALGFYFANSSK